MAYRYVPPALRANGQGRDNSSGSGSRNGNTSMPAYPVSSGLRGGEGSNRPPRRRSDAVPDEDLYSLKEIDRYFWPGEEFKSAQAEKSKTLHDSAAAPGALAYVLLFKDANPRWDSDGIIFTKSSLDLLPAELAKHADGIMGQHSVSDVEDAMITPTFAPDAKNSEPREQQKSGSSNTTTVNEPAAETQIRESQPIAVFIQIRRPPYNPHTSTLRIFKFVGYHRITRLQFLHPHSEELKKMLDQKWTIMDPRTGKVRQRERGGQGWEKSLSLRWAVVKFEKDEAADGKLRKPQIEKLEDEEGDNVDGGREKKSVNELLRELRVKDGDEQQEKKEKDSKLEKVASIGEDSKLKQLKEEPHNEA